MPPPLPGPLTAACLLAAAHSYGLPGGTLEAIQKVEGGWVGLAKPNTDRIRSQDLGPFQVNTQWLPTFTIYWRQPDQRATYRLLRDDGCANAMAAAAILRYHWARTGSLATAVAHYHTGPAGSPQAMQIYLDKVKRELARRPRHE